MSEIQTKLLGAWEIIQRLTGGVDDREPDDDSKYLWFQQNIIVTGDEWAAWDMPYVVRGEADCGQIDIMREDLWEPWLQQGIFQVEADILKLCMAGRANHPRPQIFSSSADNECVLYVAKRCEKPCPD